MLGTISATTNNDVPKERALMMFILIIFGATATFGLPVISEFYQGTSHQAGAIISVSMWNIPQRITLYTFVFVIISGIKMNKENLKQTCKKLATNSTLMITVLGLFLWLTQLIPGLGNSTKDIDAIQIDVFTKQIDGVNYFDTIEVVKKAKFGTNFNSIYIAKDSSKYIFDASKNLYIATNIEPAGWMDFHTTMPYVNNVVLTLSRLCTPLVWLTVGMKMSEKRLREVFTDKYVWLYTFIKLIIVPLIMLAIMYSFYTAKKIPAEVCLTIVVVSVTPPGTVPAALSLMYNKAPNFTARASALSTIMSIILIPIFIVLCEFIFKLT
ncbi:AEC family transporter [Mycoplasma sp. ES3157-GEN-MYC]|uniref:Membrane transport protein n=1 Tax=Mycoplasma miroungigenitalium TaxID=754515 RepID=A0A6M4JB17_9MOLU|nr:AEC family transporter [Mycoplasma miroungigenitalium]MBU4690356.1 AEC family transporter [Mycoplasma miroungigenitalium]QJR43448.1 hypothetical protein HLA87_01450 [Mycoplasma miroungigenitalium]